MKTMVKLICIVSVLFVAGWMVNSEENESNLTEDQGKIRDKLIRKGYRDIRFGEELPSTDGAYVVKVHAVDPLGTQFDGTVLWWNDQIRIYPI